MDTYDLLCTVPVLKDVCSRVHAVYTSIKTSNGLFWLCITLAEISLQLGLLFSWPLIILCYFPIVITDRVAHDMVAFLISAFPVLMRPADEIYEMITRFVLSYTIGRIAVYCVMSVCYTIYFGLECGRSLVNWILSFIIPLNANYDEPLPAELRLTPPPSHPHSSRNPHGHAYDPAPPSPPREAIVVPGAAAGGRVSVVPAIQRE